MPKIHNFPLKSLKNTTRTHEKPQTSTHSISENMFFWLLSVALPNPLNIQSSSSITRPRLSIHSIREISLSLGLSWCPTVWQRWGSGSTTKRSEYNRLQSKPGETRQSLLFAASSPMLPLHDLCAEIIRSSDRLQMPWDSPRYHPFVFTSNYGSAGDEKPLLTRFRAVFLCLTPLLLHLLLFELFPLFSRRSCPTRVSYNRGM